MNSFHSGDRVYACGGMYRGKRGTVLRVKRRVLVVLDSDRSEHWLNKTSLRILNETKADTYLQALLQRFPEIDEQLDDLCYTLARCSVDAQSSELHNEIQERIKKRSTELKASGGPYYPVGTELTRMQKIPQVSSDESSVIIVENDGG